MKFKNLFVTAAMASITLIGHTQIPWTLEDCINYAHANNLQIKRTELQAEMANVNKVQSYTNILPDLNASLGRNYNFGYQIDPFTNEFIENNSLSDNYSISSSLNVFSGLRNYNNIQGSKFAALAAMQNVEVEKIENTFYISEAYLNILLQEELVEVAESQVETTEMQVERSQKLVDVGSAARGTLLEIQAQLANESFALTDARNNLNLAILNLTQLLDLDSTAGFEIVIPDTVAPDFEIEIPSVMQVYNEALEYLPHVKRLEYLLKRNEKLLAVEKGRLSPTIYLSASIYSGYSDQRMYPDGSDYEYWDQFRDNIAQSVSVGIRIPITNRWEVSNSIKTAKIQLDDSEFELDQTKLDLYKRIQQAHNDALSSKDKYYSAIEAVNSNRESFHYTDQKFNVGIVNSVDYNVAKTNLLRAESELLKAKYEFIFYIKILDFYRGIPITL